MKTAQVMRSKCFICGDITGCYDSTRVVGKIECHYCVEEKCPEPNCHHSSSVCPKCLQNFIKKCEETGMNGLA